MEPGAPRSPELNPLQWQLYDINCCMRGHAPFKLLGVAKPLVDVLFFDVAPALVVSMVAVLMLLSRVVSPEDPVERSRSDQEQLRERESSHTSRAQHAQRTSERG